MHLVKKQALGSSGREEKLRLEELQSGSDLRDAGNLAGAVLRQLGRRSLPAGIAGAVETALHRIADHELSRLATGVGLTRQALIGFYEQESDHVEAFVSGLAGALGRILGNVPDAVGGGYAVLSVEVPMVTLVRNPGGLLTELVETCLAWSFDSLSRNAEVRLGFALAEQVRERLLRASGLTEKAARENPYRLKWPKSLDRPSTELVETYFRGTPLHALLLAPVALRLTDKERFEHMLCTAGTGHGKTQTLQSLIARDLGRPRGEECGLIVIDSQGDLLSRLMRQKEFAGNDRLIVVDPADEATPALNLFDLGGVPLSRLSARDRERTLMATMGLYEYIVGGLFGSEMTRKQRTAFRYLIELLLSIPGATIHTLKAALEDPKQFLGAIEKLPATSQDFLKGELPSKSFGETREQIRSRLYAVLGVSAIERMFGAKENRLDLFAAMNAGKVVLINTNKEFLQGESKLFGRFAIALALKSALDRAVIQEAQRRPAFLYVDEAADYFDESSRIEELLTQARKYRLGCLFFHQSLEQMSLGLREIMLSCTTTKLVGGVSSKDARLLAPELRTSPEFILAQTKSGNATRFACFVKNLTPEAVSLQIPFGMLEQRPTMTDAELQRVLAANRARISVAEGDEVGDAGDEDGASDDDDFSSRY